MACSAAVVTCFFSPFRGWPRGLFIRSWAWGGASRPAARRGVQQRGGDGDPTRAHALLRQRVAHLAHRQRLRQRVELLRRVGGASSLRVWVKRWKGVWGCCEAAGSARLAQVLAWF